MADRTSVDALARFVDGLLVAIERGTRWPRCCGCGPPTPGRPASARLLEAGGRKEIAMMVPVVFLVLPVTVLFT